jgi:hypothetical protein
MFFDPVFRILKIHETSLTTCSDCNRTYSTRLNCFFYFTSLFWSGYVENGHLKQQQALDRQNKRIIDSSTIPQPRADSGK